MANLSENFCSHVPKIKDSKLLNCEGSDNMDSEHRNIPDNVKSREVKPIPFGNEGISSFADTSKVVNLPTPSAKKHDLDLYDLGQNPNVLKYRDAGCSLPSISDSGLESSVKESSVMSLKTVKDAAASRISVNIFSQVSNHPNAKEWLEIFYWENC